MEADPEEAMNSVHGRLMQDQDGEVQVKQPKDTKEKKKGNSFFDFKIHIYIRRHSLKGENSGSVKKYRADARKCCLYFCLVLVILALLAAAGVLIWHFVLTDDTSTSSEPVAVVTSTGTLHGRTVKSPQDEEIDEFLGIPFAEPPVGQLRYSDPVPLKAFPQEPYEATDYKYSCVQWLDLTFGEDFPGSTMWNAPNPRREDCLYLNIWVPGKPSTKKRTVMVWIYGGGFFSGSNALWVYDGKALAAHGDVIVASLNYRVGTLGFLTTGDGRIKGNFGMKDQVVALQWIKDNIAAFGGDPDHITIFGESSGASSAGLHMMSSHSEHLFERAIFESGSADAHWAWMTEEMAKSRSAKFFNSVNCSNDDNLLPCLRQLSTDTILNTEWVDGRFMVFPWAPSVDGDFLTDTPYNLLRAGKFQKKDSLLGVNRDEGTYWILYALPGMTKDGPSLHNHSMFVDGVDTIAWDLSEARRDQLKDLYAPADKEDYAGYRDNLDKVCGDRSFTCPTKELTAIYTDSGIKTHFYYLTYRSSTESWPPWMGVIHGAEIQWVFGMPMNKSRGYTDEEVSLAQTVMSYWANFAKTGDPNGPGLPNWPQYTTEHKSYVEMKSPSEFPIYQTLRDDYCQVWSEVSRQINEGS